MTDLNSTVDSVRDEKDLLSRIENNSKINIFTTVVGIGMDFNVSLVQKISCTPGEEFSNLYGKYWNYFSEIFVFQIQLHDPRIPLLSNFR